MEMPDEKLYSHLSQKQRMIQGFPYKPGDPELAEGRRRARELTHQFNHCAPGEKERRKALLQELFHPSCKDKKMYACPNLRVDYGYNIKVGDNWEANYDCCILDCASVEIGENCLMAPGVHIYTATHPISPKYRESGKNYYEMAYPVKIGNNVWIGGHATILPGINIGDNSVIGAGSVVTKNVPANVVVAGNPAKVVKHIES